MVRSLSGSVIVGNWRYGTKSVCMLVGGPYEELEGLSVHTPSLFTTKGPRASNLTPSSEPIWTLAASCDWGEGRR